MRIVYIGGKFTGPNAWEIHRNVCRAEALGFAVAQAGAMPLIPHMNTAHFHGTLPAAFWYEGTLELLRRCDALILVPGWEDSKGTLEEITEAKRLGLPVFERVEELQKWVSQQRCLRAYWCRLANGHEGECAPRSDNWRAWFEEKGERT